MALTIVTLHCYVYIMRMREIDIKRIKLATFIVPGEEGVGNLLSDLISSTPSSSSLKVYKWQYLTSEVFFKF